MKAKGSKLCFKLNKEDSQYKDASLQAFCVKMFSNLFLGCLSVVGQLEGELGRLTR